MVILFIDEKVRRLAISFEQLARKYGEAKAQRVRRRLDELDAANNLGEIRTIPAMRCQQVKGHPDLIAICTLPPSGMLLRLDGDSDLDAHSLIWEMVTTVKIITLDDNAYE
jgi:plasmid maintenance system killer protein